MNYTGLLIAQTTIASVDIPREDLLALELFEEACIHGEVAPDRFQLKPAKFLDLPRQGFGRFYDERRIARVWKTEATSRPTFLVFFEREDAAASQYQKGCGIVQKGLDLNKSFSWLLQRIGYQMEPMGRRKALDTYGFVFDPPSAHGIYFFDATKMADQSTVIRILYRNPEQIAEFLETEDQ